MTEFFEDLFLRLGLGENADWVALVAKFAVVLVAMVLAYAVARLGIIRLLRALMHKTRTQWDDQLLKHKVLNSLAKVAPALVLWAAAPLLFELAPPLEVPPGTEVSPLIPIKEGLAFWAEMLRRGAGVWIVFVLARAATRTVDAAVDIYYLKPGNEDKPIRAYAQVASIMVWMGGWVMMLGVALDKSPWGLLTGIGAMMALLLLIFRDTILSLVASVQIGTYDLVRRGDWLEMPSLGVDGEVEELSLHTVKVRNWDKTITAVPTHMLLERTYKNWRGMSESGGRRIKRAVRIDMSSVHFLDDEDLARMEKVQVLKSYLVGKRAELSEWNSEQGIDAATKVNGRNMTNLGTFRAYLEHYLKNLPVIRQDMTFLIRQLDPEPTGLPLEIYVFSAEKRWAQYESIQADIFDHVLAVLPEFGLRVFQEPTGADMHHLAAKAGA